MLVKRIEQSCISQLQKVCPSNNEKNCAKKIINEMNGMEWNGNKYMYNAYFENMK